MSELTRHTEANDVEEKRHAEAGELEMATHVENTRSYEELSLEVESQTLKAHREMARRDVILGILVIFALAMMALLAGYTLITRNHDSKTNGRRIDALTLELTKARDLLLAEAQDDAEALDCQHKFDTLLRSTGFEPLAAIGDLVVIISTDLPGPEREKRVADNIIHLGETVDATRQTIAQLAEWNDGGNKLPCPIQ